MTDIPEHLIRRMEEERTTVRVPIEDLRTIVDWENRNGGPFTFYERACFDRLAAALPAPEPSAPIRGYVQDTGGGTVKVVIDRDTKLYPRVGERVVLTFGEPVPERNR